MKSASLPGCGVQKPRTSTPPCLSTHCLVPTPEGNGSGEVAGREGARGPTPPKLLPCNPIATHTYHFKLPGQPCVRSQIWKLRLKQGPALGLSASQNLTLVPLPTTSRQPGEAPFHGGGVVGLWQKTTKWQGLELSNFKHTPAPNPPARATS